MIQPPPLSFDAVLLAAGHSRRMGTDKALLATSSGDPVWQRQWRLLGEAGAGSRWLSVRAEQSWVPSGVPTVSDARPDGGPLAGVVAAWEVSSATHLFVLAVDLPALPVDWMLRLKERVRPGGGVAGLHPGGYFEPLAAVYPRSWLRPWSEALNRGSVGLQALLRTAAASGLLSVETISAAEAAWFQNLNTPDDLRRDGGGGLLRTDESNRPI